MITRRNVVKYGLGIAGAAAMGVPGVSFGQTRNVPFSLDFRIYGANSPFFLGESAGIFKELGFSTTLDGSSGSGETIRRVATGTHDFGMADVSTLVEFAVANPETTPKLIMSIFDHGPQTILTLADNRAETLADLKGRRIGIGANSGATKLMPALMKLNDLSMEDIEFVTVDVKLRDTMLVRGEVEGVVGFDYTSIFNLIESGIPMEDIHTLDFSDFGFDFPANSLIASKEMIENEPELCRAVALGVARAWRAAYQDPGKSVDAVIEREPLLVRDVELQRLQFVLDNHVATESVKANGLGHIDPARMEAGAKLMAEGFGWETAPPLELYYDPSFLPEKSELMLTTPVQTAQ